MAKKVHIDANNPALSFISAPTDTTKPQMQTTEPAGESTAPLNPPAGYRLDPRLVEVKSRRVQLVFRPSTYEKAQKASKAAGVSLNEYIHYLIDKDNP